MHEQDLSVAAEGRAIDGYLAFPRDVKPGKRRPTVIVIHEIFDPDAHIRQVARRFADLAYVAAAPDLFTGELNELLPPPPTSL